MENKQPITITTKTSANIEETLYNPREEEEQEELQQIEKELQNEVEQDQFTQLEQQLQHEQLLHNQFQQQINQNPFFQTSEMSKQKRDLIRQIRKYRELFDKNIVTMKDMITDDKLVNYDEKMLENLLIEVDEEISSIESVKAINSFIETGLTLYEKTFSMFNVDINGFKSDLLNDSSFNNAIARLVIRSNVSLSPQKTIILKLLECTYKNLKTNKFQTQLLPNPKSTKKVFVEASDIEKYKDL